VADEAPSEKECLSRKNPERTGAHIFLFLYKTIRLKIILNEQQLALTIQRLSHQVLENHAELGKTVFIGIQPRGIHFSDRLMEQVKKQVATEKIQYGKLDITFYRDDIRQGLHTLNRTDIPFSIEKKNVVLIDDVLYTGRTIRAALDALLDFGRPAKVELCILIDRRFSRELPIQADYIGKSIDSILTQKVKVCWKEKDGREEVELL
jgi:pyrimidine operon attenuation protein/uracil phosphoribosyltransferase